MAPSKTSLALAASAAAAGLSTAFVAPAAPASQVSQLRGAAAAAPQVQAQGSSAGASVAVFGAATAAAAVLRQPAAKASRKSVVSVRAFENELGVQAPVGFFDPAGFAADGNAENFARRRQTEIKHGRIAMLAAMGYITPEITDKLPGYLSPSAGLKFEDVPNGLAAISKVPAAGWAQILAYMAFCETSQDQSP